MAKLSTFYHPMSILNRGQEGNWDGPGMGGDSPETTLLYSVSSSVNVSANLDANPMSFLLHRNIVCSMWMPYRVGGGELRGLQPTTAIVLNTWKWRKAKYTMVKMLHANNLYKTGFRNRTQQIHWIPHYQEKNKHYLSSLPG